MIVVDGMERASRGLVRLWHACIPADRFLAIPTSFEKHVGRKRYAVRAALEPIRHAFPSMPPPQNGKPPPAAC